MLSGYGALSMCGSIVTYIRVSLTHHSDQGEKTAVWQIFACYFQYGLMQYFHNNAQMMHANNRSMCLACVCVCVSII